MLQSIKLISFKPNKKVNERSSCSFNSGLASKSAPFKQPLASDCMSFSGRHDTTKLKPYTEKASKIPDYKQTQKEFPDNGSYYCGPTSAANAIKYLSNNGFKALAGNKPPLELIKELASFFKPDDKDGTTIIKMCDGLKRFVTSKGYKIKHLEYQGYRPLDKTYKTKNIPDIDRIKKAIEQNAVVLLCLGLYRKPVLKNAELVYERVTGHWVTMVGHSHNGQTVDKDSLIIHDPLAEVNKTVNNMYLKLSKLDKGILQPLKVDIESQAPQNAKGFHQVLSGIDHLEYPEEVVVLDSAVILEMPEPDHKGLFKKAV